MAELEEFAKTEPKQTRHGAGFEQMRASVDTEGGWGGLLKLFADRAAA